MPDLERRFTDEPDLRLDGDASVLKGYAAVFNKWADIGPFKERISPGAFSKTIQEADVRALFNHDRNFVLGRSKAGTLRLEEDKRGLKVEIDPPDTQWARDLTESIKRGDVNQMSFSFRVPKNKETWDGDKRTIHEANLFDVSPVTFPAYKQTTISARSMFPEIFKEQGLDYDRLGGLFFKLNRGIDPTDEDRDLLNSTIELLRIYTPIQEPGPGSHSDEPQVKPEDFHSLVQDVVALTHSIRTLKLNLKIGGQL